MNTSVQKTLFTTFALAFAFIVLVTNQTVAATFTAKIATPGTTLLWNGGSATWNISGIPADPAQPTMGDIVIINDYTSVTIPAGSNLKSCSTLTVSASSGSNTSGKGEPTEFFLNAILQVYGDVLVSGDHKFKKATITIDGGELLIMTGYSFKYATPGSDFNKLILLNGGMVGSFTGPSNPLPVEITSFKAAKKNSEVALTWETASEKNNTGFEVQSSTDGKNYEAVGFVATQKGTSSSAQRYAFSHKTANKEGLMYYRLKQIDLDGTFEYYSAKVVDLGRFTSSANVYPNPFQNQFQIALQATLNESAVVVVTDMTGKTVYQAQHAVQQGANILNINLADQPTGLYVLKATSGNQTYVNRLVKQ